MNSPSTNLYLDQITMLKKAIKQNNLEQVVNLMVGRKLSTCVKTYDLLKLALYNGNLDIVLELVSKSARISSYAKFEGDTLLHYVAELINFDKTYRWVKSIEKLVKILLVHGFDVEFVNERNETPLHVAAKNNNWKAVDLLLEKLMNNTSKYENLVDDDGLSFFHIVCMGRHFKYVKQFLKNTTAAILIDQAVSSNSQFCPGYTALHFAVSYFRYDTVKLLLKLGADPNAKASDGLTALHLICFLDKPQWMFYENYSESALERQTEEITSYIEHLDRVLLDRKRLVVQILSETNDCDARDIDGNNALMYVAHSNYVNSEFTDVAVYRDVEAYKRVVASQIEVIKILLKHYEPFVEFVDRTDDINAIKFKPIQAINLANIDGFTCLHHAAISLDDNEETVKFLLKLGANPNAVDKDSCTPLMIAAKNHNNFFVNTILQYNLNCSSERIVNIDAQDQSGCIAAQHAFVQKLHDLTSDIFHHDTCFDLLLLSGSDLHVKCENGYDVLQFVSSFASIIMSYSSMSESIKRFGDIFNLDARLNKADVESTFVTAGTSMLVKTWKYLIMMKTCYNDFKHSEFLDWLSSKLLLGSASIASSEVFKAQCFKEVCAMKMRQINCLVSLFDVLTKNLNKVVSYTKHFAVREIIESPTLIRTFPLYGRILKTRFARALFRKSILEEAKASLQTLISFRLPELCVELILSNCTEKKLRDVIEANNLIGRSEVHVKRKRVVMADDADEFYKPPLKIIRI